MSVIFPKQGRTLLLTNILLNTTTAKLRLFQNNFTPDINSVIGDFTEATFPGYAEIALAGGPPTINGSDQGEVTFASNTYTCTGGGGPQTVYGWYIEMNDPVGNPNVLLCENFSAPQVVENNGDAVVFNLRVFDQPVP